MSLGTNDTLRMEKDLIFNELYTECRLAPCEHSLAPDESLFKLSYSIRSKLEKLSRGDRSEIVGRVKDGFALLHMAASKDNVEIVKYLVEVCDANILQRSASKPPVIRKENQNPICGEICKIKRKNDDDGITLEWHIPDFYNTVQNTHLFGYIKSSSFSFLDSSFHLAFYQHDANISFYIVSSRDLNSEVGYALAFEKADGTIEKSISGVMKVNELVSRRSCELKYSEILEKRSELAPQNLLIVKCLLNKDTPGSFDGRDEAQLPKLTGLKKLSEDFKDLFRNKETCDVILKVKDKEYKAHKYILIARSKVLAANFKYDTLESQTGVITIEDCDPESFPEFLEYLYCGRIENISFSSAFSLYYTSDKYDVEEVKTFCVEYLIQSLTVQNICEVAIFADKKDEKELFFAIQKFFKVHASEIFLTSEWMNLMKQNSELANQILICMQK